MIIWISFTTRLRGVTGHSSDLAQYADIFLKHNITGKRLLMLTPERIHAMGITSTGHNMELMVGPTDFLSSMELMVGHTDFLSQGIAWS